MVTFNQQHDHGNGPVCQGCRFREALTTHLEIVAEEGGEAWVYTTGELVELMGTASAALARLRNAQFGDDVGDPDDAAHEAAAAISRLGGVIDQLWNALMDDDAGDEHSAAL